MRSLLHPPSRFRARSRRLAVLTTLAIAAVACGSGSTDTPTTPTPTTQPTSPAPTTPGETPTGDEDPYDALVAAALAEGTVTLYNTGGLGVLELLEAAFEEKYPGIDLQAVRMTSAEIESRVEVEQSLSSGERADIVWTPSEGWLIQQTAAGNFIAPTQSPVLLGLDEFDPAEYLHESTYFPLYASVQPLAWNTELLPDGLSSYQDLLDPSLQGRIATIDAEFGAPIVDFYNWLRDSFGQDYLEALAAQRPGIYAGAQPIDQALAAGEVAATVYSSTNTMTPLIDEGAPLAYLIPEDGTWGARQYGAILANAANPNAAELLADFMLSREGQSILARNAAAVLPDIEGALAQVSQIRRFDLDEATPEKVAEFQDWFNQNFR